MCIVVYYIFPPPQGTKNCSGIKQTSKSLLICSANIKTCAVYVFTHLFSFTLSLNMEICPTPPVILMEFRTRKKPKILSTNPANTSTHKQLSSKFLPVSVKWTAILGSNQKHLFPYGFDNQNLKTNKSLELQITN